MDVQSGVVCALVFVASAVLLLLISKFGMREKSYEEALAEQRLLTSGLLGPQHRPKAKEKKPKKAGKKVKDRAPSAPAAVETSTEESETADGAEPTLKHHVEFEEPAVLESAQTNNNKKRAKKEKVKPILVNNKDKSPVHEVDSFKNQPSINHFEQIHPKDDFELLSSHHQKEEPQVVEPEVKVKKSKPDESKVSKSSKEKKQSVVEKKTAPVAVAAPKEPAVQEQQVVSKVHQSQQQVNGVKDNNNKKKKKSEFNTLQQLTAGDKQDVNVSLLVALVRKSDLSRSEIQILIDLLLNKQHEAPAVIDEWSEGRADPVQKLKKQLAEKERALAEEQEAVVSAQAKLRELRAELNQERSRHTQNCRNLEESLLAKRTEVQSFTARMHAQAQQCQQLQAQLNEEIVKMRAMTDELKTMQIQRQQLDMHINQIQEAEASLQSQLGQLRSELQETQAQNGQLNMDLRAIREKNHAEKEMLHERIRQIETQAVHYKNESDQIKQDLLMQLEDSRRMFSELEHRFNVTHRNENELKIMCQQHLEEARRQDMSATKTHDDIAALQSEITRLTVLNQSQDADNKKVIIDLQSQLSSVHMTDGVEDKTKDVEIRNLHNELSSLHGTAAQREADLNVALDNKTKMLQELQSELTAQKSKNDELRKKNWRIMDALNDTENVLRLEISNKSKAGNDIAATKLQTDEHAKYKSFLVRLFPEITIGDSDNWLTEAEKRIKSYVTELQMVQQNTVDISNHSEEMERLQAELRKYRTIIDDTESSLKQIQSEIGSAESKWRQQLDEKELEIGQVKEYHRTQLQTQLDELTEQLKANMHTKSSSSSSSVADGSLASVEQMVEEKSRLADNLVREQKRTQDLSEEIQRLRTLTESQPIKAVENHTANGTTLETSSSDLPTSTSSNSPTTKPRNKNKKKKTATVN